MCPACLRGRYAIASLLGGVATSVALDDGKSALSPSEHTLVGIGEMVSSYFGMRTTVGLAAVSATVSVILDRSNSNTAVVPEPQEEMFQDMKQQTTGSRVRR